jgi:hypothetical protein
MRFSLGSDRWGFDVGGWWIRVHLGRLDIRTGFYDGTKTENHANIKGYSFLVQWLEE